MKLATRIAFTSTLLALASGFVSCKPKGAGASVKSLNELDADGKSMTSFEILAVRNFTVAPLAKGSTDPGAKQAEAMVRTRLFALVECTAVVGSLGDKIDAATLMSAVEARSAIDDLYIDQNRNLLTSAADAKLAAIGSMANKLVRVPCRVYGARFLSWEVFTDLQLRAAGLPKKPSAADMAAMDTFGLVQTMHLTIRGNYNTKAEDEFMPRLPAVMDMLFEQAGMRVTAATSKALSDRMHAADPAYNPCTKAGPRDPAMPDVGAVKAANWKMNGAGECFDHPTQPGVKIYVPGGSKTYAQVRDSVVNAIAGAHRAVFPGGAANDPALFDLWDMLTAVAPYPQDGSAKGKIGAYLTKGSGLDFAEVFASDGEAAKSAPKNLPDRVNSNFMMAPLALGISRNAAKSETHLILRAVAGTEEHGVLDGGSRSMSYKLAGDVKGRIAAMGRYMGPGGGAGLAKLAQDAASALDMIRKPRSK